MLAVERVLTTCGFIVIASIACATFLAIESKWGGFYAVAAITAEMLAIGGGSYLILKNQLKAS